MERDITKSIGIAKKVCQSARSGNNKELLLKGLGFISGQFWRAGTNDSATVYGNYCLHMADKFHTDSLRGDMWSILGLVDYRKGAYEQAIVKYSKAIFYYQKENKPLNLAINYFNTGICERKLSRDNNAIVDFLHGIKTFETLKDSSYLASSYNSIALCFTTLKDYPKAIAYNQKTLNIRRSTRDSSGIAQSYNNIGYTYSEYQQPDSAIFYLSKCLLMRRNEKDSSKLVLTLQNLGSAWKKKGNMIKAEAYILRSLKIAGNCKMQEEIARGNLDLAQVHLVEKNYKKALITVTIAEEITKPLKIPELLLDIYAAKSDVYEAMGDYKEALRYNNKKAYINDSLFTIAKNKAISELEIRYQTAQRDKDIAALNLKNRLGAKIVIQQKLFIILLITSAALLLILFIITYQSYRLKSRAKERIQTLMQDLHHRVKNNLQILSGLFMMQIDELNDEPTKNALRENETRLAAMNLIHNKLYLNDKTTQIEMKDYITQLVEHIRVSFDGENDSGINVRLDLDRLKLEADKAVALGLIVNELTTNAFKYAFNASGGQLFISLKKDGRKLRLTLGDNGKGIKDEDKVKRSFGLKLVNLMARQLGGTLHLDTGNGTSYELEITI